MFFHILLFCTTATTIALAGLTREGRQFLPSDIAGDYTRFVNQGTCSKTVNLTSTRELAPGAYAVPHTQIIEEGYPCTGPASLIVISRESIVASGNQDILTAPPLDSITAALKAQDATFMIGFESEKRPCGPKGTSAQSVVLFVEEEKKVDIPGLITLQPGAKYMIVYDPKSPTACTYFAKFADREIGVPITPDPDGDTGEDPVEQEPQFSTEATGGNDSGDKPDDDKDPSVDKEPVQTPAVTATPAPTATPGSTTTPGATPAVTATPTPVVSEETSTPTVTAAPPVTTGTEPDPSETTPTASPTDSTTDSGPPEVSTETEALASAEEGEDDDDDGSVCFPGDALVEIEHKGVKRMDQVEIGDRVKVGKDKFSPVFMFTHRVAGARYTFVRIETACGHVLRLTSGHYLYVNGALMAAKGVRVGDTVTTTGGKTQVTGVSQVQARGLYNAQTIEGDIVVDGIIASTYTTAVESGAAHSMLAPLRALFQVSGVWLPWLEEGSRLADLLPSGKTVA